MQKKQKKRVILFVTERRADYSRLKPIMKMVQKSAKLELRLVVGGAHMLDALGKTGKIIENDGFHVDAMLPVFKKADADDGSVMVRAFGNFVLGLTDIIARIKPDVVFCGFDLGAHLAAAIVGAHFNIPVAHIQGGERSGTIDEISRHAITKFAHIHFVATKESRQRVIKLGEDPKYVFLVGSPSLDTIHSITYQSRQEVFNKYDLDPLKKLIVFLQHPVTTEIKNIEHDISESIAALSYMKKHKDSQILAIYSNNDAGGKRITTNLNKSGFRVLSHIVYEDFLRLLKCTDVLVGNSSTGIHEAPSFGLPTVNIGSRQNWRERGVNVLDVPNDKREILKAIDKSLNDKEFIQRVRHGKNPYDHGNTARQIVDILERIKLPPVQKIITY